MEHPFFTELPQNDYHVRLFRTCNIKFLNFNLQTKNHVKYFFTNFKLIFKEKQLNFTIKKNIQKLHKIFTKITF